MKHGIRPCPICHNEYVVYERTLRGFDLVKCRLCSFVFTDLTDEKIFDANARFDEDALEEYENIQTILDRFWFDFHHL